MDISEEDLRTLRPFALKVDTHMPGATFAKLPFAFPDSHINSWKVVQARVARLSGFTPELYDCCVNSCLSACPHCSENRYRSNGKPRSRFLYLPLTPRLQALRMRYRAVEHQHRPGIISDVMDSSNYRTLLGQHVVVNGKQLPHLFFDDPRDIALGASTDGFAPHRRRKKTAAQEAG
ncbi:hypothetical protein C8Q73DRAFT_747910 [Cubamyces lactineus]|nr:hypothetical protein C8Q73DRAFT_747910 [Cubamyces lactineus]